VTFVPAVVEVGATVTAVVVAVPLVLVTLRVVTPVAVLKPEPLVGL